MTPTNLDIYHYDDFRKLLKDRLHEIQKSVPTASYRSLSEKAGLKSQSHLHQVINGKKKISSEVLEQVATAFEFGAEAKKYLVALSRIQQAESPGEREHFAKLILSIRGFRKRFPLSEAHFHFYKNWYYIVVFELMACRGFQATPDWINRRLSLTLSKNDVERLFEDLLTLGLVGQSKSGKFFRTTEQVTTGEDVSSHLVLTFHQEMLRRASLALNSTPEGRREVVGLTFACRSGSYPILRDKVREFYSEMYELVSHESMSDSVYHMGIQLFPVASEE